VQIFGPGHPARAQHLNNLATSLMLRCNQSYNSDDIGEAIALLRNALQLCIQGTMKWSDTMFGLTEALKMRYMQMNMICDLQEAMALYSDWFTLRYESD